MPLTTEGGFDLFEVLSAAQKCLRRGLEKEALYWCLELAGRHDTALWRMLQVCSSEDVGPADNSVTVLIHALFDHYHEAGKSRRGRSQDIILAHAVLALCRARKSRIADNLACVVNHQRESEHLRREIPEFAIDQHTRRGKARGRGLEHWHREGCQLVNEVEGLDLYREQAFELRQRYGRLKPKGKATRRRGDPAEQLDLEDVGEA